MQEEWRDIKGYEGLYQVSNLGRVKSLERYVWNGKAYAHKNEKIMSLDKLKNGYLTANLYKNNISKRHYIHRLVAQAFLSKSEKHTEINHKDENKANNCIDNLEWCTHKENMNSGTCIERRKSNMDFFAAAKKRSNEHLIKLNKSRAKPVMCNVY